MLLRRPRSGRATRLRLLELPALIGALSTAVLVLGETTEFCGRTAYQTGKSVCCGGRVRDKLRQATATACCGNAVYDPATAICCNRRLFPKTPSAGGETACCGSYPYDMRTTLCCDGAKYARNALKSRLACCGTAAYDASAGICCGGAAVAGVADYSDMAACCGSRAYDSSKFACCGGAVTSKVGYARPQCCGTSVFEQGTATCCDGVGVSLPAGWHCCGDIPRTAAKDYCCFSGVDGSALCRQNLSSRT